MTTDDVYVDGIHLFVREFRFKELMTWYNYLHEQEHALGRMFFDIFTQVC